MIPLVEPEALEPIFAKARARVDAAGVEADYVWAVGNPADKIAATARDREARLVVLAAHHHGFLGRLFGTDVATEVERELGSSVIVVETLPVRSGRRRRVRSSRPRAPRAARHWRCDRYDRTSRSVTRATSQSRRRRRIPVADAAARPVEPLLDGGAAVRRRARETHLDPPQVTLEQRESAVSG